MSTSVQTAKDELALSMAKTNEIFNTEVFGKRNFDALDSVYTKDACILPPGTAMIAGRSAIKDFWSGVIQSMNATAAVLTSIEVTPTGDGVVEIGRAVLTAQLEGQAIAEMEVKYVVFWRQEDSQWKWHIDIWNQNS